MKKIALLAVALMTLTACFEPLTQEQVAEQTSRNMPFAKASVPACIANATGRDANYAALTGLGFETFKPLFGKGVNYKAPNQSIWGSRTNISFQKGHGCKVNYIAETDSFGVLGQTWKRAIEEAGYTFSSTSNGNFEFVANGVPMRFSGTHQISGGSSVKIFEIERTTR